MKLKAHVLISGRVQGVWFRASTKDKAEQLGITGWIKNTADGKVEAIFEGEEELIDKIIEWCHHGPPLAEVYNVEVQKQPSTNHFNRFSIEHTKENY